MNNDTHFAENPDDMLCGHIGVPTLCGTIALNTTNWDVESVTCERCLEVMEDRVVGIEKVTRVHDEVTAGRRFGKTSFAQEYWANCPMPAPAKPWGQWTVPPSVRISEAELKRIVEEFHRQSEAVKKSPPG